MSQIYNRLVYLPKNNKKVSVLNDFCQKAFSAVNDFVVL